MPTKTKRTGGLRTRRRRPSRLEFDSHCDTCQRHYRISTLSLLYDVSEKTIRRKIQEGVIRAKKLGGAVVIPHSELAKLLDEYPA